MTPPIFEPANFLLLSLLFLVLFGYFLSRLGSCRNPVTREETPVEPEPTQNEPIVEEARPEPEPKVSTEPTANAKKASKAPAKKKSVGKPKSAVTTKKAAKKKPRDRR